MSGSACGRNHTRGARSEEGCLFLDYSRSVDDPNEYICVEAFRDHDAAVHHVNTQAFKDFVEAMPDIVSAHPQIINTKIDQDGFGAMGEISPRRSERRDEGRGRRGRA